MKTRLLAGTAATVAILSGIAFARAQDDKPNPQQNTGFPDLVGGLKATPGCIGVETADTSSGKKVIFAWFKDKAAVMAWYGSKMHVDAMNKFFPGPKRVPLADVKDDVKPILVIASITPSTTAKVGSIPISQISAEMYTPVPGGASVGGKFAPASIKIKGHLEAPSFSAKP